MKWIQILRDLTISEILGVQPYSITDNILSELKEFIKEASVIFKGIVNEEVNEEATLISIGEIPSILYQKGKNPPFEERISINVESIKDGGILYEIYENNSWGELRYIIRDIMFVQLEKLGITGLPRNCIIIFDDDYRLKFKVNTFMNKEYYDIKIL